VANLEATICDRSRELSPHFDLLPFVPQLPALARVNAVLGESARFSSTIEQLILPLVKGMSHESASVRAQSMGGLLTLLENDHEAFKPLLGDAQSFVDPIVEALLQSLQKCAVDTEQVRTMPLLLLQLLLLM